MWYVSYNYELSGVRETYSSGKKKFSLLSSNKGILTESDTNYFDFTMFLQQLMKLTSKQVFFLCADFYFCQIKVTCLNFKA